MDADIARPAGQSAANDPFPIDGFAHLECRVGTPHRIGQPRRSMLGPRIVGHRRRETIAGHSGALLDAIEREQAERGNL